MVSRDSFKRFKNVSFRTANIHFLTLKTTFLTALASGARRGEILALCRGKFIHFTEDYEQVLLYPDPTFVPKTKRGFSKTRPIVLRSFKNLVGTKNEDRFLCPIRALRVYIKRTKVPDIERQREKLFLPLGDNIRSELTSNGLKNLLLTAIQEAYKAVDPNLARNFDLRLHDFRMLSHSLASASGVSLETILASGRWKRRSTFTDFYLRSLAIYADNLFSLGPIAVAGTVVRPGTVPLT
jgi:integrase